MVSSTPTSPTHTNSTTRKTHETITRKQVDHFNNEKNLMAQTDHPMIVIMGGSQLYVYTVMEVGGDGEQCTDFRHISTHRNFLQPPRTPTAFSKTQHATTATATTTTNTITIKVHTQTTLCQLKQQPETRTRIPTTHQYFAYADKHLRDDRRRRERQHDPVNTTTPGRRTQRTTGTPRRTPRQESKDRCDHLQALRLDMQITLANTHSKKHERRLPEATAHHA